MSHTYINYLVEDCRPGSYLIINITRPKGKDAAELFVHNLILTSVRTIGYM